LGTTKLGRIDCGQKQTTKNLVFADAGFLRVVTTLLPEFLFLKNPPLPME
jgi:hypothetical protein